MSSASISARRTTGIRRACAASTSGLSAATALETTTTSASPTFSRAWPSLTCAPSAQRRSVTADSFKSEPRTA